MAVIINKEDENDALSARIGADLRAKMAEKTSDDSNKKDPDMVEDADYVRDLKKTGRFAWVWIVLVIIAIIVIVVMTMTGRGSE